MVFLMGNFPALRFSICCFAPLARVHDRFWWEKLDERRQEVSVHISYFRFCICMCKEARIQLYDLSGFWHSFTYSKTVGAEETKIQSQHLRFERIQPKLLLLSRINIRSFGDQSHSTVDFHSDIFFGSCKHFPKIILDKLDILVILHIFTGIHISTTAQFIQKDYCQALSKRYFPPVSFPRKKEDFFEPIQSFLQWILNSEQKKLTSKVVL